MPGRVLNNKEQLFSGAALCLYMVVDLELTGEVESDFGEVGLCHL